MRNKTIYIVNGPNLSHIEYRDPKFYNKNSLFDIENYIKNYLISKNIVNIVLRFYQSNNEGDIISFLLNNLAEYEALIINPAAFSHYSLAIADSLEILRRNKKIVCEVHISNIFAREEERKRLVTAKNADIIIAGAGIHSYSLALEYILEKLSI